MNTSDLLKHIESSDKFLVSDQPPKFIGECQWVDVKAMNELKGKSALSNSEKEALRQLTPLEMPVTTHRFYCPIDNKEVSIGLYYYDVGGWIINSAAIYYIVNHNIEIPGQLTERIEALSLNR
jgi:hypothetical protein